MHTPHHGQQQQDTLLAANVITNDLPSVEHMDISGISEGANVNVAPSSSAIMHLQDTEEAGAVAAVNDEHDYAIDSYWAPSDPSSDSAVLTLPHATATADTQKTDIKCKQMLANSTQKSDANPTMGTVLNTIAFGSENQRHLTHNNTVRAPQYAAVSTITSSAMPTGSSVIADGSASVDSLDEEMMVASTTTTTNDRDENSEAKRGLTGDIRSNRLNISTSVIAIERDDDEDLQSPPESSEALAHTDEAFHTSPISLNNSDEVTSASDTERAHFADTCTTNTTTTTYAIKKQGKPGNVVGSTGGNEDSGDNGGNGNGSNNASGVDGRSSVSSLISNRGSVGNIDDLTDMDALPSFSGASNNNCSTPTSCNDEAHSSTNFRSLGSSAFALFNSDHSRVPNQTDDDGGDDDDEIIWNLHKPRVHSNTSTPGGAQHVRPDPHEFLRWREHERQRIKDREQQQFRRVGVTNEWLHDSREDGSERRETYSQERASSSRPTDVTSRAAKIPRISSSLVRSNDNNASGSALSEEKNTTNCNDSAEIRIARRKIWRMLNVHESSEMDEVPQPRSTQHLPDNTRSLTPPSSTAPSDSGTAVERGSYVITYAGHSVGHSTDSSVVLLEDSDLEEHPHIYNTGYSVGSVSDAGEVGASVTLSKEVTAVSSPTVMQPYIDDELPTYSGAVATASIEASTSASGATKNSSIGTMTRNPTSMDIPSRSGDGAAVLTAPDLQLDWLSDSTGDDDDVVFVHSTREPILSIDLTTDEDTPAPAQNVSGHDGTATDSNEATIEGMDGGQSNYFRMNAQFRDATAGGPLLHPYAVVPPGYQQWDAGDHNNQPQQSQHNIETDEQVSHLQHHHECMRHAVYQPQQAHQPQHQRFSSLLRNRYYKYIPRPAPNPFYEPQQAHQVQHQRPMMHELHGLCPEMRRLRRSPQLNLPTAAATMGRSALPVLRSGVTATASSTDSAVISIPTIEEVSLQDLFGGRVPGAHVPMHQHQSRNDGNNLLYSTRSAGPSRFPRGIPAVNLNGSVDAVDSSNVGVGNTGSYSNASVGDNNNNNNSSPPIPQIAPFYLHCRRSDDEMPPLQRTIHSQQEPSLIPSCSFGRSRTTLAAAAAAAVAARAYPHTDINAGHMQGISPATPNYVSSAVTPAVPPSGPPPEDASTLNAVGHSSNGGVGSSGGSDERVSGMLPYPTFAVNGRARAPLPTLMGRLQPSGSGIGGPTGSTGHHSSAHHGGAAPPYPVHQNLWYRQQHIQEIHRRHMTPTPIDLSSNPLNLTNSFRWRSQLPNTCACVHASNGPVSSLDPVSYIKIVNCNLEGL